MPKTPRSAGEDMGEGEGVKGGNGEGKRAFEPRIAMRIGGGGREGMSESGKTRMSRENSTTGKEDDKSWTRWFWGN